VLREVVAVPVPISVFAAIRLTPSPCSRRSGWRRLASPEKGIPFGYADFYCVIRTMIDCLVAAASMSKRSHCILLMNQRAHAGGCQFSTV